MMFKKLRNKLLILNIVIISIVMLISFSIIYTLTYSSIHNDSIKKLERASLGSLIYLREPDSQEFKIPKEYQNEFNTSFNILVDDEGTITQIASSLSYEDSVYYDITLDVFNLDENIGQINIEDKIWLYEISEINNKYNVDDIIGDSVYRIAFVDITDNVNALNDLLIILISVGIAMLIIIYFISMYFANKSIKPIENMWIKQKRFVADATHELKTPLTIISANTDLVLLNEKDTIKKQRKWLEFIKNETKGMNKLINELLNSAKAEEEKIVFKNVNISDALNETILIFETIIFEKNIKLTTNIEKEIFINTDVDKLIQVFKILIDNAVKYTDEKGTIHINLYKEKRKVYINVENTGVGIHKEDINFIFDRFYKGVKSRTDRKNSFGLGLFIAKTIVNNLKGEITCASDEKLTTFTIKI